MNEVFLPITCGGILRMQWASACDSFWKLIGGSGLPLFFSQRVSIVGVLLYFNYASNLEQEIYKLFLIQTSTNWRY